MYIFFLGGGGEHRSDFVSTYPFNSNSASFPFANHIKGHPKSKGPTVIGNDVWIGFGAVILSGVKIGDGAIIGARSLVTKNVPPYAIYGGNPAKLIRFRFSEEQISKLLEIQWWHWDIEKIAKFIDLIQGPDIHKFIDTVHSFTREGASSLSMRRLFNKIFRYKG